MLVLQISKTLGVQEMMPAVFAMNNIADVAAYLKNAPEREATGVLSEIFYDLIHNKKMYDYAKARRLDLAPHEPNAMWQRYVAERAKGDAAKPVGICSDDTHLIVSIAEKMGWKGVHMYSSIGIFHVVPLLVSPTGKTYIVSDVGAYEVKAGRSVREETAKILKVYSPVQYVNGQAVTLPSWERLLEKTDMRIMGSMFYLPYLMGPGEGASRFVFRADSEADAVGTIRTGKHAISAFLVHDTDPADAVKTAVGAAYSFFGGGRIYKKGRVEVESKFSLSGMAGYFSMKNPDMENFAYYKAGNPLQPVLALANLGYYLETKYALDRANTLELLTGVNMLAGVPIGAAKASAFVVGMVKGGKAGNSYRVFVGASPYLAPAASEGKGYGMKGKGYKINADLLAGTELEAPLGGNLGVKAFFSSQLDFGGLGKGYDGTTKGKIEIEYRGGRRKRPQ